MTENIENSLFLFTLFEMIKTTFCLSNDIKNIIVIVERVALS